MAFSSAACFTPTFSLKGVMHEVTRWRRMGPDGQGLSSKQASAAGRTSPHYAGIGAGRLLAGRKVQEGMVHLRGQQREDHARAKTFPCCATAASIPTSCARKLYSREYCSFPRPVCAAPCSRSSISGWTCGREQHYPQDTLSHIPGLAVLSPLPGLGSVAANLPGRREVGERGKQDAQGWPWWSC